MRKIFALASIVSIMLLASCSYVSNGLVSIELTGEVSGSDGNPIDGAKILVYESESTRNQDYEKALGIYTRGSYQEMENSCIVSRYTTNGNISSMNLVWKTSSPAYGEDYDNHNFYFLILKDGYRPATADFCVTSGPGAFGGNTVRIDGLEQVYDSSAVISGTLTDSDGNLLRNAMVFAYSDGNAPSIEYIIEKANESPDTYADEFVPGDYHGNAVSEADGRYSIKVMWMEGSSSKYSVIAIANGYIPEDLSVSGQTVGNADFSLKRYDAEEIV